MRFSYTAISGFLLGVSAFFTFVVPEAAFSTLGGRQLGTFLAAVFPRFYLVVGAFGALLVLAGLFAFGPRRLPTMAALLALLLTLAAWLWLLPQVNRAVGTSAFGVLHGISLGMDMLAMLLWLVGLLAAAGRGAKGSL